MVNISIIKFWDLVDDLFIEWRRMMDFLKFYNCVIYFKLLFYVNYLRCERKVGVGLLI